MTYPFTTHRLSAQKLERFLVFCIEDFTIIAAKTPCSNCTSHCTVRPHLELYIWHAAKSWDSGYQDLCHWLILLPWNPEDRLHVHVVQTCIVHAFFPPNLISTRPNHSQHTNRQLLHQPFAGTNAYLHSFVPHTVHAWNLFPESVVNLPLQHFKSNIVNYIT